MKLTMVKKLLALGLSILLIFQVGGAAMVFALEDRTVVNSMGLSSVTLTTPQPLGLSNELPLLTLPIPIGASDVTDILMDTSFTVHQNGQNIAHGGTLNGTLKSGDTVLLAHNQGITITELPKDTTYTVTEKDYSAEGYTVAKTGDKFPVEMLLIVFVTSLFGASVLALYKKGRYSK